LRSGHLLGHWDWEEKKKETENTGRKTEKKTKASRAGLRRRKKKKMQKPHLLREMVAGSRQRIPDLERKGQRREGVEREGGEKKYTDVQRQKRRGATLETVGCWSRREGMKTKRKGRATSPGKRGRRKRGARRGDQRDPEERLRRIQR